uniref:Aspecific BCL-2 ARE binding protein 3 n=1 Tax=Homo sapiens TaxID=9606 RepID=Q86YM8_HUMAN|nr:aspecific BCL-2 ARE binding protein 3 [Homo sapiens]
MYNSQKRNYVPVVQKLEFLTPGSSLLSDLEQVIQLPLHLHQFL